MTSTTMGTTAGTGQVDLMMASGAHPTEWDEFVGQTEAKRQLRIKAAAARATGGIMDHMMLYSPEPGIGKTSLAMLIAKEAGRNIRCVSGQLTVEDARFHLSQMSDGDVLLWDEQHMAFAGARSRWEWMLHYYQQGVLMTPMGVEQLARVTIIGATTDMGKTPETIEQRLGAKVQLQPYSIEEQWQISGHLAAKIMPEELRPHYTVCAAIAQAANGKPRLMQRMFKHLRDLAVIGEVDFELSKRGHYKFDLSTVFAWEGVTPDGLTDLARAYLRFLYVDSQTKPVGLDRITERLREDRKAILSTEQLLLNKGLIVQSSPTGKAGRVLTTDGLRRAKELA